MFYSLPSTQHPGHYCTFLEICSNSTTELPTADQHLPSFNKELGSCPQCPEYVFLQKTEKERHNQLFHPSTYKRKTECSQPKVAFKCNYLVARGQVCNRIFANIYQLRKHRQKDGHLRKSKKSQRTSLDPQLQQYTSRGLCGIVLKALLQSKNTVQMS